MLSQSVGYSTPSVLRNDRKVFLDSIDRNPSKERAEEIVILWQITAIKVVYLVDVFDEQWVEGVLNMVNDVVKCEELVYIEEFRFWLNKMCGNRSM
jgi:hypothetical protein